MMQSLSAARLFCSATMFFLTWGMGLMTDAASPTSSVRRNAFTFSPFKKTTCTPSSYRMETAASGHFPATFSLSARSTPSRSMYRATARYMAPVST